MDNLRFVASKAGYSISVDVKFAKVARTKMDESADSTFARGKAHSEDEIDRRGEKPVSERRIHICVLRHVIATGINISFRGTTKKKVSASFI